MKKIYAFALFLALALGAASFAPSSFADNNDPAAVVSVGEAVTDFKLPDANDGKERTLSSLKGPKGTVLIFVATKCPVSNDYNARMAKLAEDHKARGINVVGINSNVAEPASEVKQHAAQHGLNFTILKDPGNKIADRLGAQVTPEAYVLDAGGKLVYRGRIDNSRNGSSITAEDLRNALEEVLAGKPVTKTEVRAFGCSIKRAS